MMLSDRMAVKPIASDVARMNDWLDSAFLKSEIEMSIGADLKLCINEAVANLIGYAFSDTTDPSILVEVDLERQRGKAVVYDNGAYFDIREWPAPEKPKDLMSASLGGFGVALIRERASHIGYERVGAINQLTIVCDTVNP
jgi:anti-sigma regulatory factor (Ser/Thr protein kinase)